MRQRLAVLAFATAVLAGAGQAEAIPAFGRRYQVECHFCHDIYPKLNLIGQRFKEHGFRMEREDSFDVARWVDTIPVSVRAQGTHLLVEDGDDQTFGFFKGISAGHLGERFSYWIDDGVLVQEGDDRVAHSKPDNVWLRYEVVLGGKLYARAGRLELDLPFTQTRTPHLFSYEIYAANTGFETDNIGGFQDGLEVGGDLPNDFRWSAAVVKGRNSEEAEDLSDDAGGFDANLYLRASKRVERHRFGAFAYIGRNTLAQSRTVVWDDSLLRLGADANVWLSRLNLYGVFMYGRNDNSIATVVEPDGTQESLSFDGGFVQADYHMADTVALTLRLNLVRQPDPGSSDGKETFSSLFPGVQFWPFPNVKLSFEYGFLNQERPSFGAVQAEVAF
jgi:hypothetical protein